MWMAVGKSSIVLWMSDMWMKLDPIAQQAEIGNWAYLLSGLILLVGFLVWFRGVLYALEAAILALFLLVQWVKTL